MQIRFGLVFGFNQKPTKLTKPNSIGFWFNSTELKPNQSSTKINFENRFGSFSFG